MDQNSYIALQAICMSMHSLLGPNKSLKCYVSGTAEESAIVGDAKQVLDILVDRVEHPVGQLLLEACLSQQTGWGCGVTSVVCLGSHWAREVWQLLQEGIPLPVVLLLFEEALQVCESVFTRLAVPLRDLGGHIPGNPGAGVENCFPGKIKWTGGASDGNTHTQELTGDTAVKAGVTDGVKSRRLEAHTSVYRNVRGRVVGTPVRARVMALSRHFGQAGTATSTKVGKEPTATSTTPPMRGATSEESLLSLLGAGLAHGREVAMRLAVRALQLQSQSNPHQGHPDPRLVLHQCAVGVGEELSTVVTGVVARLEPEMVTAANALHGPTRVMVVSGDATPGYAALGLKHDVTITSFHSQQLWEDSSTVQWVERCAAVVKEHGLGLLAVGGTVSTLLWDHCLSVGVVIVKQLTQQQCHMICHMTGSATVTDVTEGTEKHVGAVVKVCLVEGGWDKPRVNLRGRGGKLISTTYCTIQTMSGPHPLVSTVILCGRSRSALGCLEQQLLNCLARLAAALEEGCVLPGGGVAEATCVRHLRGRWAKQRAAATETVTAECTGKADGAKKGLCMPVFNRGKWNSVDQSSSLPVSCDPPLTNKTPLSLRTSWLSGALPRSRARVYQAVANGLRQLTCSVLMNAHPGMDIYQAQSQLEGLVETCSRGKEGVLDLKQCKYESWLKAYHLVRTVFLAVPVT